MKRYYKTELHTHTTPVSVCSTIEPKQLVKIYKENGYDSVVVTNHFTTHLKGETVKEKINWYLLSKILKEMYLVHLLKKKFQLQNHLNNMSKMD